MSRLVALLSGKCPQCEKGKMFTKPFYKTISFWEMNINCAHCGLHFEIEPGFFYGAMYLSYAITVGIMLVGGFVIYNYFGDPSVSYYIFPITILSILLTPINFRVSRICYMYIFSGIKKSV